MRTAMLTRMKYVPLILVLLITLGSNAVADKKIKVDLQWGTQANSPTKPATMTFPPSSDDTIIITWHEGTTNPPKRVFKGPLARTIRNLYLRPNEYHY